MDSKPVITEDAIRIAVEAARALVERNPEGFTTREFCTALGLDPLKRTQVDKTRAILHQLKDGGVVLPVEGLVRLNLANRNQPRTGWVLTPSYQEQLVEEPPEEPDLP